MDDKYERLNRWIDQLQAGQPPDSLLPADPAEAALFQLAAAWAALRPGAAEPDPTFLVRLQAQLHGRTADSAGGEPHHPPAMARPPLPHKVPRARRSARRRSAEPGARGQ